MDTIALWANCGKPQCDTRTYTRVKLSIADVVVRNGFGRVQPATVLVISALPTYISVSRKAVVTLVNELRAKFTASCAQ